MNVSFRAPLTAAAAALLLTAMRAAASAQSMDPATAPTPIAPQLIAPHAATFKRNSADASPAGVTRERWFGATGTWQSSTEDGLLQAHVSFTGLVPGGRYSLFSRHASKSADKVAPLDLSGATTSFVASPAGSAITTITLSQETKSGDEVLLVYQTNDAAHPKTIGALGTNAFIQLRLVQP